VSDNKIKLKYSYRVIKSNDDICILNAILGKSYIVKNENNGVFLILKLIKNGCTKKTLINYTKKILRKNTINSTKYINDTIKNLQKIGAFEQNNIRGLSKSYLRHLVRQIKFLEGRFPEQSSFELQEKIQKTRVVIIGLGGIANYIILNLISLGFYDFTLIDFDKVEKKNLGRQPIFRKEDIGNYKTAAVSKYIKGVHSRANVKIINLKLETIEQIKEAIKDADVVIPCCNLPRFEIQKLINIACIEMNKFRITIGSDFIGPLTLPSKTACYQCLENFLFKRSSLYVKLTEDFKKDKSEGASIGFTGSMVATYVAKELFSFIVGLTPKTLNGTYFIRPLTFDIKFIKVRKDPKCRVCSNG